MSEQETLDGTANATAAGAARPAFDPLQHGLWRRVLDGDGHINHAAWLRACAEHGFVGTCRRCGGYLAPAAPDDLGGGRIDYEAHCAGCGGILNAPGGRVLTHSARRSEQPRTTHADGNR